MLRNQRQVAIGVLLASLLVSAVLILYWGRGQTFALDEWGIFTGLEPPNALRPHGGHLLAVPYLIQRALLDIFGATSQTPFVFFAEMVRLAIGALIFILARRRVGDLAALIPT